ncbi:MAG: DUF1598 domain-containing protein [Planctomycetales bacterium]|nr:DUF1598 domain-containing protein [Planctomycetales bacterium]
MKRCIQGIFALTQTRRRFFVWLLAVHCLANQTTKAQPPSTGNSPNTAAVNRTVAGNLGGAQQADFDTLIELITSTVDPDSWDEFGGEGSIQGFPGGVYVDANGVLQRLQPEVRRQWAKIVDAQQANSDQDANNSSESDLRIVSLKALANRCRIALDSQQPLPDDVRFLAGMYEIRFVQFVPDESDILLAGLAGPWHWDAEGRPVHAETGRPVLQLDDLVVLLRCCIQDDGQFLCSITPYQEKLADTQAFIQRTTAKPFATNDHEPWARQLQDTLGNQRIDVKGIPAETRVARTIVEADYHMKRVGLGLADSIPQVPNYLDLLEAEVAGAPPALGVLRWWFTLNEDAFSTSEDGLLFDFAGPSVKLLSENELLAENGRRVHTGDADKWNRQFAQTFTANFTSMADKYPVYWDLENVFDLAMVASIAARHQSQITSDSAWQYLLETHEVLRQRVPKEVMTVVSHRVIRQRHVVAAISGGVAFPKYGGLAKLLRTPTVNPSSVPNLLRLRSNEKSTASQAERIDWYWN